MKRNTIKSKDNPFTLQFSFVPPKYILRFEVKDEIIDDLNLNVPGFRCHFITGVRGSGKTSLLAYISNFMSRENDWVCVDIENPESNLIDSLARGMYRNPELNALFVKAKLDFSILGLGISIEKASAVASNENDAVDYMLKALKGRGKRVLVTIDEVTYSSQVAGFSHALSAYARAGYEIYVLMTGLRENINKIKNDKSLTFLYRAKTYNLMPLSLSAIANDYEEVFKVNREKAVEMARLTCGYSFAFQLLGYLYWEALTKSGSGDVGLKTLLPVFDQYLEEFSYVKIWSELSLKEKEILSVMARDNCRTIKDIREKLGMDSSKFSVYRGRLIDKGLLDGSTHGVLEFILPRFSEFVSVFG